MSQDLNNTDLSYIERWIKTDEDIRKTGIKNGLRKTKRTRDLLKVYNTMNKVSLIFTVAFRF